LSPGSFLVVATQRDRAEEHPEPKDLLPIATLARVRRVVRVAKDRLRMQLDGLQRVTLGEFEQTEPYFRARSLLLRDEDGDSGTVEALLLTLKEAVEALSPPRRSALGRVLDGWSNPQAPGLLADRVAGSSNLDGDDELELLQESDVESRLRTLISFLVEARTRTEVERDLEQDLRRELGKGRKEALLRRQMEAIKKQLGESGEDDDELSALRRRLAAKDLPEEAAKAVARGLKRLSTNQAVGPEAGVIRNHLELIADLPWNESAEVDDDIDKVEAKLDADHFGLDEVKKRILEHLAVMSLGGRAKATILCLAGPPGTGKTSLGKSIADATGRPFVRISLGGVRDEAEIRGHRRTYVGALPGRILHALTKAKANNPVMLLDEIDKLSQGWQGSPEAALLEVLDPEQNDSFTDHYLELPFDLSEVLFLVTANDLSKVSAPLRDRLEIIHVSGYTSAEKAIIGRRHLLPDELDAHAIGEDTLSVSDDAIQAIISGWTREAGVRQLKREIRRLVRGTALRLARGNPEAKDRHMDIGVDDLDDLLGKRRFFPDVQERTMIPGVATGLAWTPVGGDILFVETSRMPGKGTLLTTGQLGDVMQESAKAALTYVRSHAEELGIDPRFLETQDIHIHVPAGGTPKDGPSAGVTIFTALTSLLTGRRVRSDTAMTGECSLRGRVLPVGGVKEKVLAAHRAGLTRVILPARNERDLVDIPDEIQEAMTFVFAEDMTDVLDAALEPEDGDLEDVLSDDLDVPASVPLLPPQT
jgi:ATP-dependent Lon protease